MASEHEHVFDDRWTCAICDEPARRVLYDLTQQLADTREALRIALAQRQDYRAHLAEARALLEEAAALIESEEGDYSGWRGRYRAFRARNESAAG